MCSWRRLSTGWRLREGARKQLPCHCHAGDGRRIPGRHTHSIGAWPIRMSIPVPPRPAEEAAMSDAKPAANQAGTMDLRELSGHLAQRWRLIAACVAATLLLA